VFHTLSNTSGALLSKVEPTTSESEQRTARALMTPDEVRNLPAEAQLLFLAGQRPVYAGKLRYYSDRRFEGLFDSASLEFRVG